MPMTIEQMPDLLPAIVARDDECLASSAPAFMGELSLSLKGHDGLQAKPIDASPAQWAPTRPAASAR